ncbi:MAG: hypothetical protein DME25_05855 [Verrucomicrobia bacterium]|nr:MAG: hypothetical protein DME25_05855 [Verrucomicrobiota bacterium]
MAYTLARRRDGMATGVRLGPLCGPAGAWVLLWSALLLQAASLLDNWWQQSYGLGAGLWAPPQLLKAAGFFMLLFCGVMLCAGARASGASRMSAPLLVWHGGLLLTLCAVFLTMANYPNRQHAAFFYLVSSAVYPAILLAVGRATGGRWAVTGTALVYMGLMASMVWLLPLFPARPLTPPIHNPTTRFMPPPFPLLLVAPALLLDWALRSLSLGAAQNGAPHRARVAAVAGFAFLAAFVPVQWFFSQFLLSPRADNWFFAGGGRHWPFFLKIDRARVLFWGVKEDPLTWRAALLASLLATLSAWLGLRVSGWLSKLRR